MKTLPKLPFLLLAGLLAFSGCKDDEDNVPAVKLIEGDSDAIAPNGNVRTWARTTNGKVDQVGITLDKAAYEAIVAEPGSRMIMLHYPKVVEEQAGITMGSIDWNPAGHPQSAVYEVPHFDFHFFVMPHEDVIAIPEGDDTVPVPSDIVPANYTYGPPGSVPHSFAQMGVHYTDQTAPEFHGQAFSKTFVYGYSKGKAAFMEPMVAKALLDDPIDNSFDIVQPVKRQYPGNLAPRKYRIKRDDGKGEVQIILEEFDKR